MERFTAELSILGGLGAERSEGGSIDNSAGYLIINWKGGEIVELIAEMVQYFKDSGKVNILDIYENRAILRNEKEEELFKVYYKPEKLNFEMIKIAECAVIDDIKLGFDLSDYFGDDYNVVTKFK